MRTGLVLQDTRWYLEPPPNPPTGTNVPSGRVSGGLRGVRQPIRRDQSAEFPRGRSGGHSRTAAHGLWQFESKLKRWPHYEGRYIVRSAQARWHDSSLTI